MDFEMRFKAITGWMPALVSWEKIETTRRALGELRNDMSIFGCKNEVLARRIERHREALKTMYQPS